ncbi:hypothetical protein TorRG33x02_295760 [Trema orientale]|uniref:Uncharacterized protein n=1 Tax=Trema orientale TaxID=63057 RepID=A0A2P5C6K9_TREOI|nr:hypothetical protein TorRG33x02_295760 [Trema orientale]
MQLKIKPFKRRFSDIDNFDEQSHPYGDNSKKIKPSNDVDMPVKKFKSLNKDKPSNHQFSDQVTLEECFFISG